jgi:hypothetical protein
MDKISAARDTVSRIRLSLPDMVDLAQLNVRSKAPTKLLLIRESLIWRTEELSRNACDALERNDFAAAALLTRAVLEGTSMAWRLMELLETHQSHSPEAMDDLLMKLLMGSKVFEELPDPCGVLSLIDRMDKKVPGVRSSYDHLSEIAHPNWSGVLGLYSQRDEETFTTRLGRSLRGATSQREQIASALVGSLSAFEYAYNKISDELPGFLASLEPIHEQGDGE